MKMPLLPARRLLAALTCAFVLLGSSGLRADEPAPGLIEVKVTGTKGLPILLIPGLATPGSVWDDTVARLSRDHTCYVVNLAGFGGMPPVAKREHFLADVRDALLDYTRVHRLDHPVVVGHSLGGVLALDLAAKAPDLPARLVVVDSVPFLAGLNPNIKTAADAQALAPYLVDSLANASPEKFAAMQKAALANMVTSPEKAAAIAAQTSRSDPATVGQALGELFAVDHRPDLPAIRCPVLILGALADKVSPFATREQFEGRYRAQYANLPQAKFQFFPDARHFIMVDDPAAFETALLQALAEAAEHQQEAKPSDR